MFNIYVISLNNYLKIFALEWNTNFKTVSNDVDHYIAEGFPLSWMVVGSGFWPDDEVKYATTTSFGAWDPVKYPDPKGFINYFHKKGLKFIIGLRIAFIPNGLYIMKVSQRDIS